jgi:hypothetical protein
MERLKQIWKNYKEISPYFSSQKSLKHKDEPPPHHYRFADTLSSCSDFESSSLLFNQLNQVSVSCVWPRFGLMCVFLSLSLSLSLSLFFFWFENVKLKRKEMSTLQTNVEFLTNRIINTPTNDTLANPITDIKTAPNNGYGSNAEEMIVNQGIFEEQCLFFYVFWHQTFGFLKRKLWKNLSLTFFFSSLSSSTTSYTQHL